MKHTSLYHDAERWTKNAARTVWKNMTYDNAMKAMTVAAAVPAIASSAGVVGAGIAAGSGLQVEAWQHSAEAASVRCSRGEEIHEFQ